MASKISNSFYEPIEEDTVQCIFFSLTYLDRPQWEHLCEKINETIKSLSDNYIWHRDVFKVYLPDFEKKNVHNYPMHLRSVTCFGDNIEDEWFIVYLVKNVTKIHINISVQIQDSDGEFLLIEAANFLPSWANSNTVENRVFIYHDNFHLIPPNVADLNKKINITEALQYLKTHKDTKSSSDIENAIFLRIKNFKNLDECSHTAVVKLPIEIATVLRLEPQQIANIVNAYMNNDDSKCCHTIKYENLVDVHVKFTKFLYAMIMQSKHKQSFDKIVEKCALTKDKKTVLGLKITCGYLILTRTLNEIYSSEEYKKYIENLKNIGYFKNNLEGSKDYQKLLINAKDYFSNNECSPSSEASYNIKKAVSSPEFPKIMEVIKNSTDLNLSDDSDEWMTVHLDELNNTLNSRYGKKHQYSDKGDITSKTLQQDLNHFLNKTSNLEGVETEYTSNTIEFEPDEFQSCIEKFLGLLSTNNDLKEDSDSFEDEEYISENEDIKEDVYIDHEIKSKLCNNDIDLLSKQESILHNFLQSIKEEKAASGPSSNLLQSIGIEKTDLLDSDDDEETENIINHMN